MEIIEIKGNKESKSRYKTILAGMEKRGDCFEAFLSTADRRNPRARFSSGDVVVRGRSKEKVLEQVLAIIATFPPEHTLHFIDMTEREASGNG